MVSAETEKNAKRAILLIIYTIYGNSFAAVEMLFGREKVQPALLYGNWHVVRWNFKELKGEN